uniref:Uncharacterized protein n=1 Tax=viral metagenome TaxID=1070528 RepID=A0A6M3JTX9_9ZZZZ
MKNKTLLTIMALVFLLILNITTLVGHIGLRNELKNRGVLSSAGERGFSAKLYEGDFWNLSKKIHGLEEYLGVEEAYRSEIKYTKRKDQK